MGLLVYEFITGGGMLGEPLPDSLQREGEMMRDALLCDLAVVDGITIAMSCDPRCVPAADLHGVEIMVANERETRDEFFQRAISNSKMLWPIAPESDGALERLATTARKAGKIVLASDAATLACAASKRATSRALNAAGVKCVPTFSVQDQWPALPGPWVVKPDDGAGAIGIGLQANQDAAFQACLATSRTPLVAQPWLAGEALSLSMLCARGQGLLLSVNRQHVLINADEIKLVGITVNALPRDSKKFTQLAQDISAALPGLWGYVGVDLILANDELTVLEINPRLTTSYCGLREALDINVAKLVLQLLETDRLPEITPTRDQSVKLDLSEHHVQ